MEILKKLNKFWHHHPEITEFCIHTVRFKKLLENANALIDLYDDGKEKIKGEYILDRHYIVSLTENIIERLGMIAYDVGTLSPENGKKLFAQYDTHREIAEKILSGELTFPDELSLIEDDTAETYPEFHLLSSVLTWFYGEKSDTIIKMIKQSLVDGLYGIFKPEDIHKWLEQESACNLGGNRIYLFDLWQDAFISGGHSRSPMDMESIPLKCLLGETDGNSFSKTQSKGEWLAVASEWEMGVMSIDSYKHLRIDASLSGNPQSDYIFIFAHNRLNIDELLPPGFHTEKSGAGHLCWKRGGPAGELEKSLMEIGQNIFA